MHHRGDEGFEADMGIYNVFIVSKSGGLIYDHKLPDSNLPVQETEKTFSFPLDIKLRSVC